MSQSIYTVAKMGVGLLYVATFGLFMLAAFDLSLRALFGAIVCLVASFVATGGVAFMRELEPQPKLSRKLRKELRAVEEELELKKLIKLAEERAGITVENKRY